MKTLHKHITILILSILISGYLYGQDSGLAIYHVNKHYPDFTKVMSNKDCYYCFMPMENELIGKPIISEDDIEFFDWESQQIKLKNSSKYKLDSLSIPLQGLAVAITIDKEPIYGLWFWNEVSSFGCDAVCTFPRLDFKIKFGLPLNNNNGIDPRFNSRLHNYIVSAGLE